MKLAGVIYLHDISQPRMLGKLRRNLDVFHKLCGDNALSAVILGTTKWEEVDTQTGEARERQLRQKFWAEMIQKGSVVHRFESNHTSAWYMVNHLLALKNKITAIHIQRELVELQKRIVDTDAGKSLQYTLEQALEALKKKGRQLEEGKGDVSELHAEYKACQEQIRDILQSLQHLNVSFTRRIMENTTRPILSRKSQAMVSNVLGPTVPYKGGFVISEVVTGKGWSRANKEVEDVDPILWDGQATDIVIPCVPFINISQYSLITTQYYGSTRCWEKHCAYWR
jgi:hypothetical protein